MILALPLRFLIISVNIILLQVVPVFAGEPFHSVPLRIIFPEQGDTLNYEQVRFAGATHPDAHVQVQSRQTKVYPSGAFVGMIDLRPGWNTIHFQAKDDFRIHADSILVYRTPPEIAYPPSPTAVAPQSIKPAQDIYLMQGEVFNVQFRGSPKGKASFTISGIKKQFKMKELSRRKTGGMRGIYHGTVVLAEDWKHANPMRIKFRFQGVDGHTFSFEAPGRINALPQYQPQLAVTIDSTNQFLAGRGNSNILMTLPAGLRLQIVEYNHNISRVRLARHTDAYIQSNKLKLLPPNSEYPYAAIGNIETVETDSNITLKLEVTERVPFRIEQSAKKQSLELSFYRAVRTKKWVYYPPQGDSIKSMRTRQKNGDVLNIKIFLNLKQQWGYNGRYVDKEFWLTIRKAPLFAGNPAQPLAGLKIAVDAGHGGEYNGVISATGLSEKTINLDFARRVSRLLEAKGARIVATRERDTTVTLHARVLTARQQDAHIFLSLHHNSIGANVKPLRPRGTSSYYTLPQSQELAKQIYEQLQTTGLKSAGCNTAPFVVTRQTDILSCLIEGAFLTHPEDELLVLDTTFREKMAEAVVNGVCRFALKQIPESSTFHAEGPQYEIGGSSSTGGSR